MNHAYDIMLLYELDLLAVLQSNLAPLKHID